MDGAGPARVAELRAMYLDGTLGAYCSDLLAVAESRALLNRLLVHLESGRPEIDCDPQVTTEPVPDCSYEVRVA